MGIIDKVKEELKNARLPEVIKFDGKPDDVVWKFPADNITYFSQLVVNESYEAIFFKEGRALDVFSSGTHSLKTGNIPLLEKFVNMPFGGETPFTAEVYYINKSLLQRRWGTSNPIAIEDPKFKIMIELRAFGYYTIRLQDVKNFVVNTAGSRTYTAQQLDSFLRPMIVSRLNDFIAEVVGKNSISVVQISQFIEETSAAGKTKLASEFSKYGIEILDFIVESINFDKDDPMFQRVQKAIADKFELDTLGTTYEKKRTLDIGEAAAKNEGNPTLGVGLGAGLGAGIGLNLGNAVGGMMGNVTGNVQQQPVPQAQAQQGAAAATAAAATTAAAQNDVVARLAKLKTLVEAGLITQAEFDEKKKEILSSI
jgi:membrane protease subunit (stomatin/prohibitin family)